jgi:hypothetical protein
MSKKADQTLKKCEDLIDRLQELKKALGVVTATKQSNRTPVNALGAGWSQDPGTGAFHHSTHGVISTMKGPEGSGYNIVHGGRSVGRVGDMSQAGTKIKDYVKTLKVGDTGSHNIDPMSISKDDQDIEKSGYGPKKAGLYSPADNAKRKMNNVGGERFGNQSVKSYTGRAFADRKAPSGPASPVKQYSPAEIAAAREADKIKNMKKSSWADHPDFPNADSEVKKLAKNNPPEIAENLMANQLANLMQGRSMLGTPPPKQPTDNEMFGHLAVTEEMEKTAQKQWEGNAFNNFLMEATKPISSRFASEEEELAYWASIKVPDSGGTEGY